MAGQATGCSDHRGRHRTRESGRRPRREDGELRGQREERIHEEADGFEIVGGKMMTISSLAGSAIGGPGFKRVMESPFDMLCIAFPRWADGLIRLLGPILWKHGYKERGESTFWYLEKPEITYDGVTGAPNCNPNVSPRGAP